MSSTLKSFISSLFEGAILHQHDIIVATNKPFCKLFQITEHPERLAGKNISDILHRELFLQLGVITGEEGELIDRKRGITFRVKKIEQNGYEVLLFQPIHVREELSDIIHDMNNPLGALSLGLFNINQRLDPESKKNQEKIVAAGLGIIPFQNYLEERKVFRYLGHFEKAINTLTAHLQQLRVFRERYFVKEDEPDRF